MINFDIPVAITLPSIRGYAKHGVEERERAVGQLFLVSVRVYIEGKKAALSDNLRDTIDYVALQALIRAQLHGASVRLLEHLAYRMALSVLKAFKKVEQVSIRIKKPYARLGDSTETTAVQLALQRNQIPKPKAGK